MERVKHPRVSSQALPWLFLGQPQVAVWPWAPPAPPIRPLPAAEGRKEAQMAGEAEAPSQAHPAVTLESTVCLLLLLLPRTIGRQPAWPQLFPLPGPGLLPTTLLRPLSLVEEKHRLPAHQSWTRPRGHRVPHHLFQMGSWAQKSRSQRTKQRSGASSLAAKLGIWGHPAG